MYSWSLPWRILSITQNYRWWPALIPSRTWPPLHSKCSGFASQLWELDEGVVYCGPLSALCSPGPENFIFLVTQVKQDHNRLPTYFSPRDPMINWPLSKNLMSWVILISILTVLPMGVPVAPGLWDIGAATLRSQGNCFSLSTLEPSPYHFIIECWYVL